MLNPTQIPSKKVPRGVSPAEAAVEVSSNLRPTIAKLSVILQRPELAVKDIVSCWIVVARIYSSFVPFFFVVLFCSAYLFL